MYISIDLQTLTKESTLDLGEVRYMKDEKNMECCCCDGTHHYHHGGKMHLLMLVGIFAFVYGAVNYLALTYAWAPYTEWMIGGAALIIIGWIKKMWKMKMYERE